MFPKLLKQVNVAETINWKKKKTFSNLYVQYELWVWFEKQRIELVFCQLAVILTERGLV